MWKRPSPNEKQTICIRWCDGQAPAVHRRRDFGRILVPLHKKSNVQRGNEHYRRHHASPIIFRASTYTQSGHACNPIKSGNIKWAKSISGGRYRASSHPLSGHACTQYKLKTIEGTKSTNGYPRYSQLASSVRPHMQSIGGNIDGVIFCMLCLDAWRGEVTTRGDLRQSVLTSSVRPRM